MCVGDSYKNYHNISNRGTNNSTLKNVAQKLKTENSFP